jgi:TonB family protein
MRRVRQVNAESTIPMAARLTGALVLSLGLHAALLAVPGARPGTPAVPPVLLLHATLLPAPSPRPADPVAGKADRVPRPPESARAPVDISAEAESPAVPDDPIMPSVPGPAVEAGVPAVSDAVHYEAKDLDTYPRLRGPLSPVYPPAALAQRLGGAVTLLVLIDETGRVTETSVLDAVPEGSFDEPARDALARASFTPASKDGRIVRSRILVSVAFDPERP